MDAKSTDEMLAEAKAAGVEVRVTQRQKGTGEIALLPGAWRRHATEEFDEFAPERDDDGTGVDE